MADEEDSDLNLEIPLKALYEEFSCPICFSNIDDCMITPCGHNFCSRCIKECLNRKHQCPCCNAAAQQAQLVKNHHMDKLIHILTEEKESASKRYFERLIKQQQVAADSSTSSTASTTTTTATTAAAGGGGRTLSPIEIIFHRHMKTSLTAYEEYYRELARKFEAAQEATKSQYAALMAEANAAAGGGGLRSSKGADRPEARAELERRLAVLTAQCEERLGEQRRGFDEAVRLLLDSYEKFMADIAPRRPEELLPVTVSLCLPQKGIRFEGIVLKPTDNVRDVKAILRQKLADANNPMLGQYSQANIVVMRRPADAGGGGGEEVILMDESKPIVSYRVMPGAELHLKGEVQLNSDRPKLCMSATWAKDCGMHVDYFRCDQCAINWVCRTCAENCHRGHPLVEFRLDFVPTWACCYCVKERKCTIINSKNKDQNPEALRQS